MNDREFMRRVLMGVTATIGLLGVTVLLVRHPEIPLLLFAAVLGAVFLDALAGPLTAHFKVPRPLAVGLAVSALLGSAAATFWLIGPRLVEQGTRLVEGMPEMLAQVQRVLPVWLVDGFPSLADWLHSVDWESIAPYVFGSLTGLFATSLGIFASALAVFALAIFLVLQPQLYREGALKLVPRAHRDRLRSVSSAVANALRWWLVGRAVAMLAVAALTGVGLALLGIPLALSLALVAGLLSFVPFLGPLLAAGPALLVALSASPELTLLVAALYWGVQLVENYVVTPIVQGKTVSVPPALMLLAQISMSLLLGVLGVALSTPLAVALIVVVQALYVQDVLGEPVSLLGASETENDASSRPPARSAESAGGVARK